MNVVTVNSLKTSLEIRHTNIITKACEKAGKKEDYNTHFHSLKQKEAQSVCAESTKEDEPQVEFIYYVLCIYSHAK